MCFSQNTLMTSYLLWDVPEALFLSFLLMPLGPCHHTRPCLCQQLGPVFLITSGMSWGLLNLCPGHSGHAIFYPWCPFSLSSVVFFVKEKKIPKGRMFISSLAEDWMSWSSTKHIVNVVDGNQDKQPPCAIWLEKFDKSPARNKR